MAYVSQYTGPEIDRRLTQGTYDDAVAAGFTGSKEQFDKWIAAYTPEEMEKLNNKQDKEDQALETENKTVVGAINYLNSNKQDKTDDRLATESKIVVDAINEVNTKIDTKQDKTDEGFSTEQKTVVGAVNELHLMIDNVDDNKQDAIDENLDTNDKNIVGAINEIHGELDLHVSDYNKHMDDFETFKSETNDTLRTHSTYINKLTQEKQEKTDFNLETESKTITSAINEVNKAVLDEIDRATKEDARLEDIKVSYTDISDSSNPDRRTIMLKNHDSISGFGTDGKTAYNIAMVSKWDKADFGAAGIPINLNGSEDHPTYNDSEKLAFVSELTGETSKLEEDIKNLNETISTVNQNLSTNIANLNKNVAEGFDTINKGLDDEIRPAIAKNAKDIGVVNDTLTTKIEETEEKLQTDINYLKPRVATLETLNIVKVDPENENYAASYELQDSTGKVYGQRINIATDQFIKSVSYDNQILTIVFILQDGSEYSQNIDVSELMNVYTAGGGITITENGVVSISDDTLQMIQYSDSEVRRLEKDKIPYAYDEKTQSNINVILPEGGSYLGNYGDENATVAKAAVYDGIKQLEIGSSKVHTNINTDSNVTIETSTGKKTIATTDELVNVVNIPIRSLKDKVYTQSEIFDWFGVTSIPELKQKIARGSQMYLRYGISLSGNPMYYKMPIEYTAFESANQIKLVCVGLNTRDDVTSKYEILINLDGTIIEGNSNVKLTLLSLEPDLSQYALKSEIPDISKEDIPTELPSPGLLTMTYNGDVVVTYNGAESQIGNLVVNAETVPMSADNEQTVAEVLSNKVDNTTLDNYALKSELPDTSNFATKDEIPSLDGYVTETALDEKGYLTSVPEEYITESELTAKNYATKSEIPDVSNLASKDEIPDVSNLATKSEVTDDLANKANVNHTHEISNITGLQDALDNKVDNSTLSNYALASTVTSGLASKQDTLVSGTNIRTLNGVSLLGEGNIQLDEGSTDYALLTNKPSINNVTLSGNLSFEDLGLDVNTTWEQIQNKPAFATVATSGDYNDLTNTPNLTVYQTIADDSLTTSAKTIPGAINEIKTSVDSISDPYEINLTNLLSAEDSESISTAIGGIDNLNATVQDNRLIVGTISNGSVSVSIRILGNVTTLYYLLDSVLGLTLNEVAITNTSGTLSKSVTTHSVLTENMVINSLNSDETTLPLSAAQGKALDSKISGSAPYIIEGDIFSKDSPTSEEIDTAIGGWDNLVAAIQATKLIFLNIGREESGMYCPSTLNQYLVQDSQEDIVIAVSINTPSQSSHHILQIRKENDNLQLLKGQSDLLGTWIYNELNTTDKTVLGAINELKSDIDNIDVSADITEAINALDSSGQTTSTGEVISSVSQENGVISVSKKTLTSDDIPKLPQSKITDLDTALAAKQDTLTAGTGIEITPENQINVTLDTNVFFVAEIVPESPSEDQKKKICLVPADTTEEGNFYTEYVWVVDDTHPDGYWEEFGTYKSEVDLTPYLKTVDAAATYLSKTDAASTYQPVGDYATTTALTEGLATKQNSTDDTLETTSKNIVGAINEVNSALYSPTRLDVSTLFADSATITSELSSQIAAYGNQGAPDFPVMYTGVSIGNIKPTWIRTSAGVTNFMCIADNKIWYFEIQGTTVQRASLAIS